MAKYAREEAEQANASAGLAATIAARKRELAEKKAKEVCFLLLFFSFLFFSFLFTYNSRKKRLWLNMQEKKLNK